MFAEKPARVIKIGRRRPEWPKQQASQDFAHLRCGEMQKGSHREGGSWKNREKRIGQKKMRGATGRNGLSRPIPQICVVLVTIRR